MARKVSMSQIAKEVGVSVQTVSRVINQPDEVSLATRERVERVIQEHGYETNHMARSLKRGHGGLVDFLTGNISGTYELAVVQGVETVLTPTDFRLVLTVTYNQKQHEQRWIEKTSSDGVDGVIVLLSDDKAPHIQQLQQRNIPFVVIDPLGELSADTPSVGATNIAGGRLATQYLLSLGHRQIAFLAGGLRFRSVQERLAGYRLALEDAGITIDPRFVKHNDDWGSTGYTETHELLDMANPPTAIFASNDLQALGAYKALYERNIRVPDQMSVIGFDDALMAKYAVPPLTTIRFPLFEMGHAAANLLLRLIAGERIESLRMELATALVERGSCAPIKQ